MVRYRLSTCFNLYQEKTYPPCLYICHWFHHWSILAMVRWAIRNGPRLLEQGHPTGHVCPGSSPGLFQGHSPKWKSLVPKSTRLGVNVATGWLIQECFPQWQQPSAFLDGCVQLGAIRGQSMYTLSLAPARSALSWAAIGSFQKTTAKDFQLFKPAMRQENRSIFISSTQWDNLTTLVGYEKKHGDLDSRSIVF